MVRSFTAGTRSTGAAARSSRVNRRMSLNTGAYDATQRSKNRSPNSSPSGEPETPVVVLRGRLELCGFGDPCAVRSLRRSSQVTSLGDPTPLREADSGCVGSNPDENEENDAGSETFPTGLPLSCVGTPGLFVSFVISSGTDPFSTAFSEEDATPRRATPARPSVWPPRATAGCLVSRNFPSFCDEM